ncbi:alpha/beta hydrolase [Euzebyella saccharophila]|uniref:Alpha/beta hydrolase n=1 Tax=Euzebyella saccharophila TaxID=679664 RepID=A0ABV8JJH4_9FLAO|nr:carboxylesterase family protein [Euzebyella saccharophila]
MSKKYILSIIAGLTIVVSGASQDFETLTYFKNDTISLKLDLFVPKTSDSIKVPLVIYVHGGGFVTGKRENGHNLAKHLVENNIACATISYSLYMKGRGFGCNENLSEKVKAIQIASSQLWQATAFLREKSSELNLDSTKIFIAGSSAGAETVMHAAYWNRNQMQLYENRLPTEFKYAGVISGAGALMDLNLITKSSAIPFMGFHGDADPLVPYKTASHHYCAPNTKGWLMLFGSHTIAKHLESLNETTELITFEGGKHSYAGVYFYQNQKPVSNFIKRVLNGERFNLYKKFNGEDQN